MSFLSFIDNISSGIESVAPVVRNLSELSDIFLHQTSNTQSAGNYGGTGGSGAASSASGTWYKNPLVWVGAAVVILFLFGKKLMRLFK